MREELEPKNKGPGGEKETFNTNPFYLRAIGGLAMGHYTTLTEEPAFKVTGMTWEEFQEKWGKWVKEDGELTYLDIYHWERGAERARPRFIPRLSYVRRILCEALQRCEACRVHFDCDCRRRVFHS